MATGPSWAMPTEGNSDHKDQYVTSNGLKLHYVREGAGQTIVLLHGNEGTLEDFTLSVFDKLAAKYQTLAFDRPGHGGSQTSKSMASPEVQAKILHDALVALKIEHPLLVAHSWSGSVALSYALQYPEDLAGMVLLGGMAYETKESAATPSCYAVRVPVVGATIAQFYKATGRNEIRKELEKAFSPDPAPQWYVDKFLASMFRLSELKAAASDEITLNTTLKKISPLYGAIKVPVVIVVGENDRIVPPQKHSYALHRAIAQSKLIVLAKAGHEIQFTRPQEVLSAIDLAMAPETTDIEQDHFLPIRPIVREAIPN
jgi:pimeloyl-ACP methyl ester carboxylesterase